MALREPLIKTDGRCAYQMLWWGVPVGPHGQYESCRVWGPGLPKKPSDLEIDLTNIDPSQFVTRKRIWRYTSCVQPTHWRKLTTNAPCCPLLLPNGQPITHLEAGKMSVIVSLHRDQRGRSFSQMAVRWNSIDIALSAEFNSVSLSWDRERERDWEGGKVTHSHNWLREQQFRAAFLFCLLLNCFIIKNTWLLHYIFFFFTFKQFSFRNSKFRKITFWSQKTYIFY